MFISITLNTHTYTMHLHCITTLEAYTCNIRTDAQSSPQGSCAIREKQKEKERKKEIEIERLNVRRERERERERERKRERDRQTRTHTRGHTHNYLKTLS